MAMDRTPLMRKPGLGLRMRIFRPLKADHLKASLFGWQVPGKKRDDGGIGYGRTAPTD
jgi:hypothetical protein